ncbi:MAG: TatD family hydrolase [Treponema sp.]|nr:TatD family hydrolase [Treponema sp.]
MLTDAHCHPCDLFFEYHDAEKKRRTVLSPKGDKGVIAAASAWNVNEFAYNEELSLNAAAENKARMLLCFAVHPQLPANCLEKNTRFKEDDLNASLYFIYKAAKSGKLSAVGEFGFDLFNDDYKKTETVQDMIFETHLKAAIDNNLPVVLHVRRATRKIFLYTKKLLKCKAVIFHSWPGTSEEALSLLNRGINAYFSFGNIILLNHKQAMKSVSLLPADRILTETDAPYQPRGNEKKSCWNDIPLILKAAASLRSKAGNTISAEDLETRIELNFKKAFNIN